MDRSTRRALGWLLTAMLCFSGGACSCSGTNAKSDAGTDAGLDAGTDAGVASSALFLQRNVAGSVTSTSQNYRLVRTHGRETTGDSQNYSQRDAVHGGGRP